MRLLVCSGMGENEWCTNHALIWAFRQLGCEVLSCGPRYNNQGNPDIEMPDRSFPETYDYRQVLERCPWTPDFILQIVPHFYLTGPKPKGIKSGFYCTDQHATGMMFKRGAQWGNFDYLFVGQPAYGHFFLDLAPVVKTILPAFDERRFNQNVDIEPNFDLSFVGMSGLALTKEHWNNPDGEDEAGKYITNIVDRLPNDSRKYACSNVPSYDYAPRAELLYRLSQEFNVRICEPLWDSRIQCGIQKGRIGFNRSLLNDLSIRNWEIAASRRLLVTDSVQRIKSEAVSPYPEWALPYPEWTLWYESNLFAPFYENFNLEYEQCAVRIGVALRDSEGHPEWALQSQAGVFASHTWRSRAMNILDAVGRGRNGRTSKLLL